MSDSTEELLLRLFAAWKPAAKAKHVGALAPDASMRRYFRILFEEGQQLYSTVLAMVFDSTACPEADAQVSMKADDSYVELTGFLYNNGFRVPQLLHDDRAEGVLFVEDLGDSTLADILFNPENHGASGMDLDKYYRDAVDQIVLLQKIPSKDDFFPYQRRFEKSVYLAEMQEFLDFVVMPHKPSGADVQAIEAAFAVLAEALIKHPLVLSHRDFHSWNLLLEEHSKRVFVVDFQDALLAPRTYDIAALLNDRDSDLALGQKRSRMLFDYFRSQLDMGPSLSIGPELFLEYCQMLLQRDLKAAGRFAKLSQLRGLQSYEQWIPGTLRRITETVDSLLQEDAAGAAEYCILSNIIEKNFA